MTWADTIFLLPEVILAIGASLLLIAPVSGFRSDTNAAFAQGPQDHSVVNVQVFPDLMTRQAMDDVPITQPLSIVE